MKFRPEKGFAPPTYDLRLVPLNTFLDSTQAPPEGRAQAEEKHGTHSPGGRQARKDGCFCPMMHDRRGNVTVLVEGHPMLLIRKGCPVHTPLDTTAKPEKGEKGAFSYGHGAVRKRAVLTKEEEQDAKDKERAHGGPPT
jgi:hypothetical protein